VWDSIKKRMSREVWGIGWVRRGEKKILNYVQATFGDSDKIEELIGYHVVLMQCTGVRDESGRLIYEGDVVKTSKELSVGDGLIRYVNYEDGSYWMMCASKRAIGVDRKRLGSKGEVGIRILGNTYQNDTANLVAFNF